VLYTLKKQLHSLGVVDSLLQGKIAEVKAKGKSSSATMKKQKKSSMKLLQT